MTHAMRFARAVGTVAIACGLILFAYAAFVTVRARVYRASFHPAAPVAPPRPAPLVDGAPIGEIRVDRIGLRTVITQGESDAVLALGAGHLADTPWPGQPGNVVLAGHRDTVFRPLAGIRAGDVIDLTTTSAVVHYVVTSTQIVDPTDLSVLDASTGNTLTLITCFPFVYVGHAPHRFIVRASELR